MNFLRYYFGQHHDKKVVYFAGLYSRVVTLVEVLKTSHFEDIVVVFEDSKYGEIFTNALEDFKLDYKKNNLSFVSKDKFLKDKKYLTYTFAFDHFASFDTLVSLVALGAEKVVGFFQENFDTFGVWEKAREKSKNIVLARIVNDYRNEVLDYEKDESTPYELSVVLPVYNIAPYLRKCFDSISAWKAPYIQFVFVDDGSSDNSAEVIEEFIKEDSRVILLRKKNGGCASARQYGVDNSQSRYIGFIDPDDFVDPTMFKKLLSRALIGSYDISYSGYYEYYEENGTFQQIEDVTGFPYTLGTSDTNLIDELIAYRRIAIWRGIYRREFIKLNNIRFHEELKRFDDLPFKVETFAKAKSVATVDEPLYFYRMGRPGQDVSVNDERLFVHFDIFKILDDFFEKNRRSGQMRFYKQVKVQTHYWALSVISLRLFDEYKERASKDLGIENNDKVWKKLLLEYYKKEDVDFLFERMKKKGEPILTVIMPFYNSENYLESSIKSLLSNDFYGINYIFVDDGSTDNSKKIVSSLIKGNSRAALISIPHSGVSKARNEGLKHVSTPYVWFIDSDDEIKNNALDKIYDILLNSKDDVLLFSYEKGTKTISPLAYKKEQKIFDYCFYALIDDPYCWDKVYRTELLKKNNITFDASLSIGEDALFNVLVFHHATSISVNKNIIYKYHFRNVDSVMNVNKKENAVVTNLHFGIIKVIFSKIDLESLLAVSDSFNRYMYALATYRYKKEEDIDNSIKTLLEICEKNGWKTEDIENYR